MFELTEDEWQILKSQSVMSSGHGGRRMFYRNRLERLVLPTGFEPVAYALELVPPLGIEPR